MGIALLGALSLMTLLGLLIVGAVAATTVAQRSERLSWSSAPLAAAADYALASVVGNASTYGIAELPFGEARLLTVASPPGDAVDVSVAATRLRGSLVWLVAEARSSPDAGYRRLNLVARFATPGAVPPAAVLARGPVVLGPGVVSSADTSGATADPDCAVTSSAPSVQTSDSASLFQLSWQRAALDSALGVWHVRGDTVLAAATFSGILLVDGDLTFDGVVEITGLVVAGGRIRTTRPGLRLVGAMIAQSPGAQPSIEVDDAWIRYSPCAVSVVLRRAAALRPVAGRAWSELF